MRSVSVTDLTAGSHLAQPVLDARGRILFPAGTRLSATLIAHLERWGITTVAVHDPDHLPPAHPGLLELWDRLFAVCPPGPEAEILARALERWEKARRSPTPEGVTP